MVIVNFALRYAVAVGYTAAVYIGSKYLRKLFRVE